MRHSEENAGCKMWHVLILNSTLWWQWERVSAKMSAHRETQLQNDFEQEEGTMESSDCEQHDSEVRMLRQTRLSGERIRDINDSFIMLFKWFETHLWELIFEL